MKIYLFCFVYSKQSTFVTVGAGGGGGGGGAGGSVGASRDAVRFSNPDGQAVMCWA